MSENSPDVYGEAFPTYHHGLQHDGGHDGAGGRAWYTIEVDGVQDGPAYATAAERDDAFIDALYEGSMTEEEAAAGQDWAALDREAPEVKLVNWRHGTEHGETEPELPDGYAQGVLAGRTAPGGLTAAEPEAEAG
jgi:hypothetical protein